MVLKNAAAIIIVWNINNSQLYYPTDISYTDSVHSFLFADSERPMFLLSFWMDLTIIQQNRRCSHSTLHCPRTLQFFERTQRYFYRPQ
jgi:hypothetical protein